MNRLQELTCLVTLVATGTFFLAGFHNVSVSANNTPQTLPFSQNWTDGALITANDDWSLVPGIVGYLGDISAATTTNVDPRTLLLDYSSVSAVDVIANQTAPDTLTNGGVAEFAITNPVVALNGSGTADAPHIIIHLNTTGQSGIQFTANIRDIDASVDDAVQQIDVQYRVGGTGNYTSVTGGYFADVTMANTATTVTPINVTLPADANNQALVQIRVMTTNAGGNDEWVGIDDINVTGGAGPTADAPVDFNGDGRTDYAVVRNVGGGPSGQVRWFYNLNNSATPTVALDWGLAGDFFIPEDFDGDGKDDIAVWRPGAPTVAAFYILNSATSTARVEAFGQTGDDPTVVGDYGGDNKADLAVYRPGAVAGAQSTWFYRTTPGGGVTYTPWGQFGDFEAPGDYNGDGKYDFAVQRSAGGQGQFWILNSAGSMSVTTFGLASDVVVPGDYDGDGKTDIATARAAGAAIQWHYLSSLNGSITYFTFGNATGDFITQGMYDNDNKTDVAVWDQATGTFISRNSTDGGATFFRLGATGDYPPANYNQH